jgi:hypothetical protein
MMIGAPLEHFSHSAYCGRGRFLATGGSGRKHRGNFTLRQQGAKIGFCAPTTSQGAGSCVDSERGLIYWVS